MTPVKRTHLSEALRNARTGFVLVGIISIFANLLMLVSPIYMLQVFDRVLTSGRAETLLYLTVIAFIALMVMGLLEALRLRALTRISLWLGETLFRPLVNSGMLATLRGRAIGSEPMRDLSQLRTFIGSQQMFPFFDAPWVPIFVAVIWLMHPWLGMFALGCAIVLFIIAIASEWLTSARLGEANKRINRTSGEAALAFRNADSVQAMGMMDGLINLWRDDNRSADQDVETASDRSSALIGMSKAFRLMAQVGILGLGAWLSISGQITPGAVIAGSILLGRALAPVEQSIGAWRSFVNARQSYSRLKALFEAVDLDEEERTELPAPKGRVTLDRVSFVHGASKRPTIKVVSMDIAPGEVVAIVGPTASGKSTLCRLIVGSWRPSQGHVRLDGAEVHHWPRQQFGRHVGYLPQSVELFSGSVKRNIARMQEAPDAAVVEAAKAAGCHDMILQLPQGYETDIGPGGTVLSGGQRQRVGLARAVFGMPTLVVLDEPNSNLDQEGDAALLEAIRFMKDRGSTVVLVAHRPNALAHVDKVAVMRDGSLQMFGPRDEILQELAGQRQRQVAASQGSAGAVTAQTDGRSSAAS